MPTKIVWSWKDGEPERAFWVADAVDYLIQQLPRKKKEEFFTKYGVESDASWGGRQEREVRLD